MKDWTPQGLPEPTVDSRPEPTKWHVVTAQLSHVELLHLLFNLTALWSLGDVEATDGFAAKGGVAYIVQMSIVLLLLSGVVSNSFLLLHGCSFQWRT